MVVNVKSKTILSGVVNLGRLGIDQLCRNYCSCSQLLVELLATAGAAEKLCEAS